MVAGLSDKNFQKTGMRIGKPNGFEFNSFSAQDRAIARRTPLKPSPSGTGLRSP